MENINDTDIQIKLVDSLIEKIGLVDTIMLIVGHLEEEENSNKFPNNRKICHDLRNVANMAVLVK